MLGWEAWCTLAVIALVLFALLREWGGADTLMMAGLLLLGALGVVTPAELFAGFANPVLPTIAALFVISAALRDTGAVEAAVSRLFLRGGGAATVLRRLCPPIAAMSAFSNNTTIVALATPSVIQWSRRARIAPSRLLLPLSHATILGGLLTVIGTSTTLAIAGLVEQAGLPPVGFFETLPVGLAVCCAGLLYLILVAPRRLPDRADPSQNFSGRLREYVVALRVTAD